ncbi:MAG: efflux RND transporter periplasmic adaptor subunit [Armatimonadetes bacterium]|nr:efflux RND transporter periplasmic adaptor subunit [Armatimonadota bacterium]
MKRWAIRGLSIGLVAMGMTACARHAKAPATAAADAAATPDVATVRTGRVTEAVGDETLAVTGSIVAGTDVTIASKIAGRVVSLGADEGQRVPSGRVLVALDSAAARGQVQQAAASVVSAKAMLNKAMLTVSLVETQSDAAVRTATAQLNAAKARRSQAESSLKISQTKSGDQGVDVTQAKANLHTAENRLLQAQQSLIIAKQKTSGDVEGAEAGVQQATAALSAARNRIAQAETSLALTDSSTQSAVTTTTQAVSQAQNQLAILEDGARTQERGVADSAVAAAHANLRTVESDFNRAKMLFEGGAVAKSTLDNAQLRLDAAREQSKQAELQASLVKEGPRQQQIAVAKSQLEQAREQLSQAKTSRDQNLALRREDLKNAKEDVTRAEQALRAANAQAETARVARGQVPISEADVASAEQAVEASKQAVRLAEAGLGSTDIAKKELEAAGEAVAQAEQGLRNANAGRVQPSITRQDIAQLRGQVLGAEAALSIARVNLRDHAIVAPIGGGIAEKNVEVGSVVSPGSKLFRLVADNYVHFNALVPEEKLRFISPGDTVDVSVDAQPDKKYSGRVLEIMPAADVRSRSFTVKVGVPNEGNRLREGMFARGSVVLQRNKRTLRVPVGAITRRDDKNWVVKVDGTRGIPCEVVIGGTREGLVEVSEGTLLPGDTIAVEGAGEVTKEQTVKIMDAAKTEGAPPAGGKATSGKAEADKPKK